MHGFGRLVLGLGMMAVNVSEAADASASASDSVTSLAVVTVTANREQEANLTVPASIGIVDEKTVKLDQPVYQKDLLNSVSGVRITQTGSTIGHITSIRMSSSTGPYFLFLQDGIPVQSSGFFNHNALAYTNFTSAGSAEVLKGAGTALYGSDAVAGTVNILSKAPSYEEGYGISSTLGSYGFHQTGLSTNQVLTNGSTLSAEFSHSESDGWRDHTRTTRQEFSASHFMSPDDNNSFKTTLMLNQSDANMAGSLIGLDELYNNPESVGDIQSALDSGIPIERKFDYARLSTEWTRLINDEITLSTIGYLRSNRNRYIATWERNLPQNDTKTHSVGVLSKVDIDQGDLRWTLGTDLEYTQASNEYQQLFDYVPSGFGSSVPTGAIYDYEVDYIAIAPYTSAVIQVTDQLSVQAGLRFDHNEFDYTNNVEDGQYASSSYARASSDHDPSFNHWSPKLSAIFKLDDEQSLYARYANAFRIPQASRLYALKTNTIEFDLDPEVSDTFEIGYKTANTEQALELALYYMTIDDTIVRRENASGERYYENGGETKHQGVEVSWFQQLNQQFAARLAYSYSEHKFVDDPDFGNNEQAEAPNDTANIRLIFNPENVSDLSLAYELEYVGKYWLDNNNTRSYDGYTITHLKANYELSDKLSLNARVNNITNKSYAENASFSYGREKYTPGAPRHFYAGIDYQF